MCSVPHLAVIDFIYSVLWENKPIKSITLQGYSLVDRAILNDMDLFYALDANIIHYYDTMILEK